MGPRIIVLLAVILSGFPAIGAPRDTRHADLFGIVLGARLILPKCADVEAKTAAPQYGLCAGMVEPATADVPNTVACVFSTSDIPDYSSTGDVKITLDSDETVQAIQLETTGLKSQQEVFALLTRKFGRPLILHTDLVANAFGARFKVIRAKWLVGSDFVSFYGAPDSIDSGYVDVATLHEITRRATTAAQRGSEL